MDTTPIFDKYQKTSLLPSLGGSDDIYQKLKKSATDIADELEQNPSQIIPYSLVALDNHISEEEPVLKEVENKISENWQMVRSQFLEMPIALYRAVIFQALEHLVEKDVKFAAVIWFTCSDAYQYMNIPHKEVAIIKDFIYRIGDLAELEAIKQWTIGDREVKVTIPTFNLKLLKASATTDGKALEDHLIAASGPHGEDSKARNESNPNWPSNGHPWSYKFAPRAAKGIAAIVDTALSQQGDVMDKNSTQIHKAITEYLTTVGKKMQEAFQAAVLSSSAVERRSQLLWWKETLYSRELKTSYRRLSKFQCAVAMAFDLYNLLPDTFPISVDYILREAFLQAQGNEGNGLTLGQFFEEVASPDQREFLKHHYTSPAMEDGRMDLNAFIEKLAFTKMDIEKESVSALGITPDKTVSFEDISVWILHCLAARKLTS